MLRPTNRGRAIRKKNSGPAIKSWTSRSGTNPILTSSGSSPPTGTNGSAGVLLSGSAQFAPWAGAIRSDGPGTPSRGRSFPSAFGNDKEQNVKNRLVSRAPAKVHVVVLDSGEEAFAALSKFAGDEK